jgi:RHS repeat-associated protein
VRSRVDGVVTEFLHAGGREIAEYAASGTLLRRYIPGPGVDQRILMVDCGTSAGCIPNQAGSHTQYYFADRQGNVLAVTGNTGAIEQHFFYTPFGVELEGDASGNPFRYTGRRFDAETGLYYYRARYYDADLGRFLQVDPVGYADQWNLYAYVGNNPLNGTDPSGMTECQLQAGCDRLLIQTETAISELNSAADALTALAENWNDPAQDSLKENFAEIFGAENTDAQTVTQVAGGRSRAWLIF